MSNLAANEQFEEGGSDQEILTRMKRGIRSLQKQAETLIIVTNEVFSDGVSYEPETVRYLRLMGEINAFLAREADWVTEEALINGSSPPSSTLATFPVSSPVRRSFTIVYGCST